jgi:hypothetical protein
VIDAVNAIATTREAWVKALADAMAAKASIAPIMLALRAYIQGVYGAGSTVCTEFGFTSRKQGKPTAATVAVLVLKNLATRKARMTMGKRQKQKVTGVVPSSDGTATAAAAPAAQPAACRATRPVPATASRTDAREARSRTARRIARSAGLFSLALSWSL